MSTKAANIIGIDTNTSSNDKLLEALNKLPSVLSARFAGAYPEDTSYCQVQVQTTMTENELTDWLYDNCDKEKFLYIGCWSIA